MKFWIEVHHFGEIYRYLVEHQPVNARTEHFILHARSKSYTFKCNRPYYLGHPGLKKRSPKIELIEGSIWNISFVEKITEAIAAWFPRIPLPTR